MFDVVGTLLRGWTRRMPAVVVTFMVRDERDVIGFNIEHCLDMGVRHIIVTDNLSADGTTDLLRAYERAGALTYIHEPGDDYRQGEWVTRMARLAAMRFGADWVFNLDADEFIWAPHGKPTGPRLIAETISAVPPGHGYFNLRRQDMRAEPGSSDRWPELNTLRDLDTLSWRTGRPLGPKAMHRADPEVTVADGNHTAAGPRIGPTGDWSAHMVLLHFPDRGYYHYEHKIRVGGAALRTRGTASGAHWQQDLARLEAGTLRDAYDARQVNPTDLPALLGSGRLVRETEFSARMGALLQRSSILRSFT